MQSWLLATAYRSPGATPPLNLELVTDEQRVPVDGKDLVCDLLALRHTAQGTAAVVVELKSKRDKTRLIEQVEEFAAVVDAHRDRFGALFGALLGRPVDLSLRCERWIVWPALPGHRGADPWVGDLAQRGIRVVTYEEAGDVYRFTVGPTPG